MIDAVYISRAALSGSALGERGEQSRLIGRRCVTRIASATTAKAIAQRQKLEEKFIEEGSRPYADALAA